MCVFSADSDRRSSGRDSPLTTTKRPSSLVRLFFIVETSYVVFSTTISLKDDAGHKRDPDDLQLIELIGRGSYGEVYKAYWRGCALRPMRLAQIFVQRILLVLLRLFEWLDHALAGRSWRSRRCTHTT